MVHHPNVYADLLGKKIDEHNVKCWLVNTGWTGGGYGEGKRMNLPYTRAMVNAALTGELDTVKTTLDPVFGLHIPVSVPNVPAEILNPRDTWADKSEYDREAKDLAAKFIENFKKYAEGTSEAIRNAGPKAG
jgi:phosphoenolpyruvate carboxykinase (ATP)